MPIIALYEFDDASTVRDDAPAAGLQDGDYFDGAHASGGALVVAGDGGKAKIYASPAFQLPRGTLEIIFTPTAATVTGPQTVLSRDSAGEHAGSFRIEVMPQGVIRVTHELDGSALVLETPADFHAPGDTIALSYSWDEGGGGGLLRVTNQSQPGTPYEAPVPNTVSLVMAANTQPWMLGAGQSQSDPGQLNNLGDFFAGRVERFSLSDTVDNLGAGLPPVANPDAATLDEDTFLDIDVLANDIDPEGGTLTLVSAEADHGTVVITPGNTIRYTPDPDWNGSDEIRYVIRDPDGNTAGSTVALTVRPVNDDPVAAPDIASTLQGVPVTVNPLANDTDVDGDPLSYAATPSSADGSVVVHPDQSLTFTPAPGFSGTAVISYTITDGAGGMATGQITVTVLPVGPGGRDGYVRGSAGDDLIDASYIDPDDGDRVDAGDAILPGDGPNDDRILAGAGDDTVLAGRGNDTVWGGAGHDEIRGGAGHDLLLGEAGDDLIRGGAGDDTLEGGEGADTLRGGAGDDRLDGGAGDDHLYGGAGNDTLIASEGNDRLHGGADRDVFVVEVGVTGGTTFIDGGEAGDDHDTLDLRGAGPFEIVFDPDNPENGTVTFLDAGGNPTGTLRFVNIETVVPCFTPGTLIATPEGQIPVEELEVGDRIFTRDNGIQDIRWIGRRDLTPRELREHPEFAPVLVRAHALGPGMPERDMLLSPNHRILLGDLRTQVYFDEHEVLVAAKHLIGRPGIARAAVEKVSYIHFMCDRHEVVLSDGAWTESFHPGDYSLREMGAAQREEILALFPQLAAGDIAAAYPPARRLVTGREARLLR